MSCGPLRVRGDSPQSEPMGTSLAAGITYHPTIGANMRMRHFAVSITAAAVMGAFGTAWAQSSSTTDQQSQTTQSSGSTTAPSGGVNVNPNVGVEPNAGI